MRHSKLERMPFEERASQFKKWVVRVCCLRTEGMVSEHVNARARLRHPLFADLEIGPLLDALRDGHRPS